MKLLPLIMVTALYGAQIVICLYNGQYSQAMIFAGYTIANVGLLLAYQ